MVNNMNVLADEAGKVDIWVAIVFPIVGLLVGIIVGCLIYILVTRIKDRNAGKKAIKLVEEAEIKVDVSIPVTIVELKDSNLKTSVDGLALNKEGCEALEVTINGSNQIVYDIVDSKNNKSYKIIHNNGYSPETLNKLDLSGYTLYLNTDLISQVHLMTGLPVDNPLLFP